MKAKKNGIYCRYIKRLFDVFFSALALLLLSPVFGIVALLVRIMPGSPVIFQQQRPGMIEPKSGKERIFNLYKFRSMTDKRDENGKLLPDAQRLTRFGKLLRATSLDELPELVNILRGDMSFVGPRPLLCEYLPWYDEEERHRHDVRPGLTGLAQVSGRNALCWRDRFAKDVEYVRGISFAMDVKVVLTTVVKVLRRSDVSEDTQQSEGNFAKIRQAELASQQIGKEINV